jgi:hypothetical protein
LSSAAVNTDHRKEAPYGVNFDGTIQRIEQVIATLSLFEMEHLPAKRGVKKQLAGLEAAHAVFISEWEKITNKEWHPKYDKADTAAEAMAGKRIPTSDEGKVFLRFAQLVDASYTAENCYSASGGRGEGRSTK